MQLSDIRRLLDAFENSDWDEIRLSVDGVDVFISADEHATAMTPATPPLVRSAAVAAPAVPVTLPATPAVVADVPLGVAVTSPSPGIFWRSPAPGTPPFVEIGQHVEAGTPVCIVEVMKLMNRVIAGVSGRVLAVPVDNSAKVERGQVLVVIDPDQPGTC